MKGETDKQHKAATKKKDDLDTKPFLFGYPSKNCKHTCKWSFAVGES